MLRQTRVMGRQTVLAGRQLEIAKKQDEILGRRPELVIFVRSSKISTDSIQIEFFAENQGNTGVNDFYWYLWFPRVLLDRRIFDFAYVAGSSATSSDSAFLGGNEYHCRAGFRQQPLYPSHKVLLGRLVVTTITTLVQHGIRWQIVAAAGIYPGRTTEQNPLDREGLGQVDITV
jgi:hypothetical protein